MANRTENVGIFTAYGFAREGGYVGTKAEFEEGLAKSANYATNAQASATAAANSATAASGSATAAAGSASTAAGYAQDADEFAQAAAASADEAEGYAESIDPDQFAKIDGYYGTLKSGESDTSDNLTPYSSDSGTSQNTPFVLQGSACANGEEQADTGSYCQLKEKRGNTVVVNQLITNREFVTTDGWGEIGALTISVQGGKLIATRNSDGSASFYTNIPWVANHKYILFSTLNSSVNVPTARIRAYSNPTYTDIKTVSLNANTDMHISEIFVPVIGETATTNRIYFYMGNDTAVGDTMSLNDVFITDLTLWFGSNDAIPTHLLNHPEDFFRYYQGSLAYNAGALTDCNGRYLKTTVRNVWDEVAESGYVSLVTGSNEVNATYMRSKNYVQIIPNTMYYYNNPNDANVRILFYDSAKTYLGQSYAHASTVKLFTTPANAHYLRFYWTGTTYNHDITISLYYEGESGYDQYYPYEELANIDTGSEPLLAFDWKEPNGTIHHDTLPKVDMATLTWTYEYGHWTTTSLSSVIKTYGNSGMPKAICDSIVLVPQPYSSFDTNIVGAFGISPTGTVIMTNGSTTVSPTGYLEVEAANPTTEQGTPFAENIPIDDFGTMAFDCPSGVPQGNTVFYPVDYKAEFDTLHNITEGDMHKIALKGELAEGEPETIEEVVDYINARIPAPPAEDGTYNFTVTVASGEATYSWVSAT